jgi:hypothetical protein
METTEKIDDIGRDNRHIEQIIKIINLTIAEKKRDYDLELAFQNDLGLYSKNIENIAADLEKLRTDKAMREMQLLENNKMLLRMLCFEVTRNKYRLN